MRLIVDNTALHKRMKWRLKMNKSWPNWLWIHHSQQKPGMDLADTYITFVRQNQDILRDRVNDEMYIEKTFDVSSCQSMNTL